MKRMSDGDSQTNTMRLDMRVMQLAELAIIVKDETYEVIKDRFSGETKEYPIDELPEMIKQRLIAQLRSRDGVSIDE